MAADAALWDLEAQITGRSAWLTAGVEEGPIETVFTIGLEDTPEAMAAKATAAAAPMVQDQWRAQLMWIEERLEGGQGAGAGQWIVGVDHAQPRPRGLLALRRPTNLGHGRRATFGAQAPVPVRVASGDRPQVGAVQTAGVAVDYVTGGSEAGDRALVNLDREMKEGK